MQISTCRNLIVPPREQLAGQQQMQHTEGLRTCNDTSRQPVPVKSIQMVALAVHRKMIAAGAILFAIFVYIIQIIRQVSYEPRSAAMVSEILTAYNGSVSKCSLALPIRPEPPGYKEMLENEIRAYVNSSKFKNKIEEMRGTKDDLRSTNFSRTNIIWKHLKRYIVQGMHVLDMGCASGTFAKHTKKLVGPGGSVSAVELVCPWLEIAKIELPDIDFNCHDMTTVRLNKTFDVIYMADTYEHVPAHATTNLWQTLEAHARKNTILYIHSPDTTTQLREETAAHAQAVEEVVPPDLMILQAACSGFELQEYTLDQVDRASARANQYFSATFKKVSPNHFRNLHTTQAT